MIISYRTRAHSIGMEKIIVFKVTNHFKRERYAINSNIEMGLFEIQIDCIHAKNASEVNDGFVILLIQNKRISCSCWKGGGCWG